MRKSKNSSTSKFKVGDRIVITNPEDGEGGTHGDYYLGDTGVIVDKHNSRLVVDFDFPSKYHLGKRVNYAVEENEASLDKLYYSPLGQALK